MEKNNQNNQIFICLMLRMMLVLFFIVPSDAFSEPNTTMTAKEIYVLLDNGQYDEAMVQAEKLIQDQPKNSIAYLALGDALSHYPVGGGDIHAAFDVWMQAKSLEPIDSTNWKFAKERLAWTMERSAVIKLLPSSKDTIKGLNKNMYHKVYTVQDVNMPIRTDVMLGGMYFSNIPTGEFILEIKPVPNLPILVQKYSLQPGQVRKIVVPLNEAEVKIALQEGHFLLKEKEGQAIIEQFQQNSNTTKEETVLESKYPLPDIDIPENTKILLTNQRGLELEYEVGRHLLQGNYFVVVQRDDIRLEGEFRLPEDREAKSIVAMLQSLESESNNREQSKKTSKREKKEEEKKEEEEKNNVSDLERPESLESLEIEEQETSKLPTTYSQETVKRSEVLSDASFKTAEKRLLGAVIVTGAYTILSNRLAVRYVNAANSEEQSQDDFDVFVAKSEQWEKQQQNSLFIATELATTYLICRTFRKTISSQ